MAVYYGRFVYSSPAVANGTVYVGSEDKNLYALDTVTGKERWRFTAGDRTYSSPAVVDGIVYVGSNDKNLYAIGTDAASPAADPTTTRVTSTERPTIRATSAATARIPQTTRQAPLQYAQVGALFLVLVMAGRKRQ